MERERMLFGNSLPGHIPRAEAGRFAQSYIKNLVCLGECMLCLIT